MKKLLFIIIVLILITAASGCVDYKAENETKYQIGELSFNYPSTWNVTDADNSTVSFSEGSYNVTVVKQRKPLSYSLKKNFGLNSAGNSSNFKHILKKNLTINELQAYEINYTLSGEKQRREVWFEKNNKIYGIIYTGSIEGLKNNDFSGLNINLINNKNSFDSMVNSVQIEDNSTTSGQPGHWGEISMPSIHAHWWITSRSVNSANSVYHLPNSYFPGERGEMALMGHHTTHDAPFLYINELKTGDKIIIRDFLTQKKYIYEVEYNGDVRWGVKGENIRFKASEEPKLLLITCYPPGFSRAAWIVHTKLVSIEPLDKEV